MHRKKISSGLNNTETYQIPIKYSSSHLSSKEVSFKRIFRKKEIRLHIIIIIIRLYSWYHFNGISSTYYIKVRFHIFLHTPNGLFNRYYSSRYQAQKLAGVSYQNSTLSLTITIYIYIIMPLLYKTASLLFNSFSMKPHLSILNQKHIFMILLFSALFILHIYCPHISHV